MIFRSLSESRLGQVILEFRREFIWVGVFSLIANILMLTPTMYLLQIYDRVMKSQNELTLSVITLIMIFFYVVMAIAQLLRSRLLVRASVRFNDLLNSLVFYASFKEFLRKSKNNTVKTFSDLNNIRQFITGQGIIAFFDLPWSPVYIVVSFFLHPLLGVLSLVFSCIQIFLAFKGHEATSAGISKSSEKAAEASSFIQTKLRNIHAVYAMGMVANLRSRWLERQNQAVDATTASNHHQKRQDSLAKFLRYCMQSLTLGAGALLVLDGKLTTGGMIAGNLLMSRALSPLDMIVASWVQFIQAKEGYTRLTNLLNEFKPGEKGHVAETVKGEVKVQNLSASAADGKVSILNDISTSFVPGEVSVIIGPSGSGKSTFARCLMGIWPETEGHVLVDGVDINEWDRDMLGPRIGYLPQDVELFDGTLAENIARFTDIDSEKVIEASRKTGIHEMILHLPDGYDSRVGNAGGFLSGGQSQRVALARALYDDPALVVLDEPNANLDDAGEKALQDAVRNLAAEGRTVILITHRPGILAVADRLLIMNNGQLADDGPRDMVIKRMKDKGRRPGLQKPQLPRTEE